MKRQKRDRSLTLFKRGFQAGIEGKTRDKCPIQASDLRSHWMSGWREGRDSLWSGMSGVSSIQSDPALH